MKKAIFARAWTLALAAALLLCGGASPALASHFRYGTLSWSSAGASGEVEFRLRAAFRRNSNWGPVNTGAIITETQGPTQFNFGDGSVTPTLRFLITAHSITENWVIGEALNPGSNDIGIRHTYTAAGPFTAFLAVGNAAACCRVGQGGQPPRLNNREGGSYPLQSIVSPFSGNRSPVSSMVPVVVVPEGAAVTFLVPAADPDGDPIQWRLATSAEAGSGPAPLHPPGLSVDAATGLVTWNNVGLDQVNFWTTQVVIEDLAADGTVKSKTPVDFLLRIQAQVGSLPTCAIDPPGPHTVVAGTPFTFTVTGTDDDVEDTVTLHGGGIPAGATLTPPLPVSGPSPVTSEFNWTPAASQEGAHVITFSVTDDAGQQGLCSTTVLVILNVPPTVECPEPIVVEGCTDPGGAEVTRTAHVEDANGDALTVTWQVDGVTVQIDNVPSGGTTTSADVSLTYFYPLGAHTVTVTVDDGTAPPVSCETTVTVVDTTAPVVQCATTQATLWPPNHNLHNVGLSVVASDACGGATTAVAVFGDEDDEMPTGDGRHSPDAKDIGPGTLRLRSERRGDADGRVYLIHAAATDGAGNTAVNCCAVTVTHDQSAASQASVAAQAAAAVATCQATGAPPPGYFVVGDGPILGPKQ